MSVTVTLHAWWLLAYLTVGVVFLPVVAKVFHGRQYDPPPGPFWRWFLGSLRRSPWYTWPITVAGWPAALWAAFWP